MSRSPVLASAGITDTFALSCLSDMRALGSLVGRYRRSGSSSVALFGDVGVFPQHLICVDLTLEAEQYVAERRRSGR